MTPDQQSVLCPNCGFAILIGATWCKGCGAGYPGIREEIACENYNNWNFSRGERLACSWVVGILLFLVVVSCGGCFIANGWSLD